MTRAPFDINEEAVRVALQISHLFGLNPVSELQVMRKQYLDGSIPTGFQRTAMVGVGGCIPFRSSELGPGRELRVRQLTLEEDSCREVSDVGHRITFRTDRLGTPLVETVTEPELLTPHDVMAGGRLLAEVARASGRVRRGAGAARQDVNVSIAGGRRVELKGVDHHRGLPLLVHNEAVRQLNLLRIRAELLHRGVTDGQLRIPAAQWSWEAPMAIDARPTLRRSDYVPVRLALEQGHMICAVRLPQFADLLGHETQPGVTFARELADRVRVIACLVDNPFMIASHVSDYGLGAADWRHLRLAAGADAADGLVVVWGPEVDVDTAIREILARAREALVGVPSETRQAFADGTTGFERILPGPERMYPDTDTPPLPIPETWVHEVEGGSIERPWQREQRYQSLGIDETAARVLSAAPWAPLFDELAPSTAPLARRLAHAFQKRLTQHRRRTKSAELPRAERLRPLIDAVAAAEIRVEALEPAFLALLQESGADPADILARFKRPVELPQLLRQLDDARAELRSDEPDAMLRWAMGRLMREALGRLAPSQVLAGARAALGLAAGEAHG